MANLEKKTDLAQDLTELQPIEMTIDQLNEWFYWYVESQRVCRMEEEDPIHTLYYHLLYLTRKIRDNK